MGTFYVEQADGTSKKIAPTIEYFDTEVTAFRKLMGEKSFWEKPMEIRELAKRALGIIYINLEPKSPEENKRAILLYQTSMDAYDQRELYVLFHPLKKVA